MRPSPIKYFFKYFPQCNFKFWIDLENMSSQVLILNFDFIWTLGPIPKIGPTLWNWIWNFGPRWSKDLSLVRNVRSEPKWTCFRTMVVCEIRLFIDANLRPILPQETNTKFTLPTILPAPSLTVLKVHISFYFEICFCKIWTFWDFIFLPQSFYHYHSMIFHKFHANSSKFCWKLFFLHFQNAFQTAFNKSCSFRFWRHKKAKKNIKNIWDDFF